MPLIALFTGELADDSVGGVALLITSPSQTDSAPSSLLLSLRTNADVEFQASEQVKLTNTSAQIRYRANVSNANTTFRIHTEGWIDERIS